MQKVGKFYEEPSQNKEDWYFNIRRQFIKTKPQFFPLIEPNLKKALGAYATGRIPQTVPYAFRETLERLEETMPAAAIPELAKQMPSAYVDQAILGLMSGYPGGAKGASSVGSVRKITRRGKTTEYASSVNLEKQKIPQSLKDIERIMAERVHQNVQGWDKTGKLSKDLYNDFEKMKKVVSRKGAKSAVEIDAIRQLNVDALAYLRHLAISKLPRSEFDRAFNIYKDKIFTATTKAAEETGRALNIFKRDVSLNRIAKSFTKLERGLNERELTEFKNLNFEDATAVKFFIDRLGNPKLKDYVIEYWYNQILSGIPTHLVNVGNNTLWYLFQVPHRAHAGVWDKIIKAYTGGGRERFVKEAIPLFAGLKSTGKGLKGAGELLRSGQITSFESKWAMEQGYAMGAFERSPSKAVREIGKYLTVPTKALRGMDVMAKTIAFDGQMKAIALRTGLQNKLKGQALQKHIQGFLKKPPDWAFDNAKKFADYATFMDEPGAVSTAIIHLRDAIPGGVGRFIVPFVNTIGNLMKRGIEMTPGVGLGLLKGQPKAEIVSKQIEGLILTTYALKKFMTGDIIGEQPDNKAERDAMYRRGEKPWSIRIGDEWFQYRRVEPFSTVIGATSIVAQKLKEHASENEISEALLNSAAAYKNFLIDSSYLSGISQIFDRYGSREGMIKRTATSMVPYSSFWRSIQRAYEAEVQGEAKLRESNDWLDAFRINIPPGLMKGSPSRLNVWGEEIILEGGAFRQWLPFKWSKETRDPVELTLKKLNTYPTPPSQEVTYRKKRIKLDDEVYRDFVLRSGKDLKEAYEDFLIQPHMQKHIENPEKHNDIINLLSSKRTYIYNKWRTKAIQEHLKLGNAK